MPRYLDPKSVPEIKEAVTLAESSAYTRAELDAYDAYWDSVSTETTLLEGKYKLGLQEGLQQGVQQGMQASAVQIAKNLLKKGFDLTMISENTGLDIELLKKLDAEEKTSSQ